MAREGPAPERVHIARFRLPELRLSYGLLVIPAIFYLGLLYFWPLAKMLVLSFTEAADPFVNFRRILTLPLYVDALRRTLGYAALATVGSLILGYPLACAMRFSSATVRLILVALVIVSFFVSLIVRTFGWMVILGAAGPIARLVQTLTGQPFRILYTPLAVQIGMISIMLPFMVLPLYSVIASFDVRLMRAGQVMGASPVVAFLTILVPSTLSGILGGIVLVFTFSIGFFITPDLLGANSGQVYTTLTVNAVSIFASSPGFAQSMAVILLIATLIVLAICSRFIPLTRVWGSSVGTISLVMTEGTGPRRRAWLNASLLALLGGARRRLENQVADRVLWPAIRILGRVPGRVAAIPGLLLAALAIVILDTPIFAAVMISLSDSAFLAFPPPRLTFAWYEKFAASSVWIDALFTSLKIAVPATVVSTVLGGLAAFGLVRADYPGKNAIMGLLLCPQIIPSVIAAVAIYYVFFPIGLVGTLTGLVLAHAIANIPIGTIIIAANLQNVDVRLEKAARVLGASAIRALLHVTLPLIRPAIIVAAFFGFIGSFDNLVYSLFLVGARIRPLPIRLWEDLHYTLSPILAVVSVVEIGLVIMVLLVGGHMMRPRQPGRVGPLHGPRSGSFAPALETSNEVR